MLLRNGRPDVPVHTQPILMRLEPDQKGWIHVDLRSKQLRVQEECMVYVEWVGARGDGRQLSIPVQYPMLGHAHYYRYGSQNRWKRFRAMATPMQLVVRPVEAIRD
jgi:hypothetical protein